MKRYKLVPTFLAIVNVNETHVTVQDYKGEHHTYKLHENSKGSFFKYVNGCRYFLHDFE